MVICTNDRKCLGAEFQAETGQVIAIDYNEPDESRFWTRSWKDLKESYIDGNSIVMFGIQKDQENITISRECVPIFEEYVNTIIREAEESEVVVIPPSWEIFTQPGYGEGYSYKFFEKITQERRFLSPWKAYSMILSGVTKEAGRKAIDFFVYNYPSDLEDLRGPESITWTEEQFYILQKEDVIRFLDQWESDESLETFWELVNETQSWIDAGYCFSDAIQLAKKTR